MNQQLIILQAVRAIEHDLLDRYGLGDEWQRIDAATQEVIRQKWYAIIERAIEHSKGNKE